LFTAKATTTTEELWERQQIFAKIMEDVSSIMKDFRERNGLPAEPKPWDVCLCTPEELEAIIEGDGDSDEDEEGTEDMEDMEDMEELEEGDVDNAEVDELTDSWT
jgi:arginine utilization protein RocB